MNYNFDKIIDRKNTDCYKWDTTKDGVIPMWVADMDFEVAPLIIENLKQKLEHGVFGYTIIPETYFEAEINWWKKRFNFDIKKEYIIPTTGVIPSLSAIIQTFCQKNDKILIQTPVYHYFNISIQNNDCIVVTNSLLYEDDEYKVDFIDFEQKLIDEKPKLFILSNPHNPVGKVFSKDELKRMGELCIKHNVLVVSDEIHRDLIFKDYKFTPFSSINKEFLENSITCTSASKTFNIAGLKSANIIIANKELKATLDKTLSKNETKSINIFGIYSLISAYKFCEDWLEELLVYLEKNRDFLEDFLAKKIPNLKVVKAQATYLLWIDISSLNIDSKTFTKKLEDLGKVRVISGVTFGEDGDNFIRVNIATPLEILKEALEGIKRVVESL